MTVKAWDSRSKIVFLGAVLILAICGVLGAQTTRELPGGLRERALVMRIVSRIVEDNQEIVWNSENVQVTIPGRPVGVKLVSDDLVVAVQFTPFLRPNGRHTLVAQGQIWINVPNEGVSYRTTMQTIPLELSEQVYFFPLGSDKSDDKARIEIELTLEPYSEIDGDSPYRLPGRRHQAPESEAIQENAERIGENISHR